MDNECRFCGAMFFIGSKVQANRDGPFFGKKCCLDGVVLDSYPLQKLPPYITSLYVSSTLDATSFCKNIKAYNNALALTSYSFSEDSRLDGIIGGN
jgi:hypothetical protein